MCSFILGKGKATCTCRTPPASSSSSSSCPAEPTLRTCPRTTASGAGPSSTTIGKTSMPSPPPVSPAMLAYLMQTIAAHEDKSDGVAASQRSGSAETGGPGVVVRQLRDSKGVRRRANVVYVTE